MDIEFERVRGFGSYKGAHKVEGLHTRCFLSPDGSIVECDEEDLPSVHLYDVDEEMMSDEHVDRADCNFKLDKHLRSQAEILNEAPFVDKVVILLYNTVVIQQGNMIKCSSMYSVLGYGEKA